MYYKGKAGKTIEVLGPKRGCVLEKVVIEDLY